jgi:small-conductance mechanosensitive channel
MIASIMNAPALELVALLALVVVLVFMIGRLNQIVPRGSRLEEWVHRWAATGQALVILAGALGVIQIVYGTDRTTWRWLTLTVVLVVGWSTRRALSDWANGITLRSEGTLRIGSRISVGDGRGRIRRLGLRSAEVEAEDGRVLRLPYTGLAEANIEISSEEVSAKSHTFVLEVSGSPDAGELVERLVTGALLSPWSSAQPSPSVRLLEQGKSGLRFEVTVYPVDPTFAAKVEAAARAAVPAAFNRNG